ncbi:MAG TPA: type II toxin-antitoxin system VapC family toxin [Streptosporangiaceae bacterium]
MKGFVLDAGAFIALERRSAFMLRLLRATQNGEAEVTIPRTVIAQVWRGGRQVNTARLLGAVRAKKGIVTIDELTARRAKQIGLAIGRCSHTDIVDVHVALAARERGHAVLTSDDGDIAKVDPRLPIVHI